jgi:peptidase E
VITYLLHGGATSKNLPGNNRFFAQFTELVVKEAVSILLCYWARKRSEWKSLSDRDTTTIRKNTNKQVTLHVVEDVKDLFSMIDQSDVLYVAGGEAELLEPYYRDLSSLKKKLNGKVYAGSSMGAFLAAQSYVLSFDSQDGNSKHKGLGLLPIQVLCHWNVEEKKKFKLGLLDDTQPIIVLNEGEFVTIYSN